MKTKTKTPSAGRLAGKVAWISGATSGIGEAAAELFAAEGARVALVGRRLALGRKIAQRINARTPGAALALACDVSDERAVARSIAATVRRFGRLDIVVNNAGMVEIGDLHTYSEAQWDRVMGVNVKSMFFAFKHAFPHLRAARRGYVVNVGSISSFVGQARTPVYTTTKHAILGLTRSIALDYAVHGIRCNCVCPGITETPMLWEHLNVRPDPRGALNERLRRVAMGVSLSPADVARSLLYFSCEDSAGITGTSLVVDCGYLTAAEWQCSGPTAFQTPVR
ncbi:MAG: SDR family oxidoreductase [Verrucomicrobia bacterium]|nr:SDR family oxidoreductase [Verrucomicrobiota bacterium]